MILFQSSGGTALQDLPSDSCEISMSLGEETDIVWKNAPFHPQKAPREKFNQLPRNTTFVLINRSLQFLCLLRRNENASCIVGGSGIGGFV